jgi:hypothetical protein
MGSRWGLGGDPEFPPKWVWVLVAVLTLAAIVLYLLGV